MKNFYDFLGFNFNWWRSFIGKFGNDARPTREGPRANNEITASSVRLILADGETAGVVTLSEALRIAEQSGLDLVEISPNAEPPVCKVLDLGKFKYEQQKRKAEAKKKQKIVELKEIKVSPNIDTHDYDVKLKNATRFLEDGNKVKFSLKFKGREIAYQQMGYELMQKIGTDLELLAKIEQPAKLEGKQMMMILGPK